MALARSASGPGGLSINTNSANSLFGPTTTSSAGGMFGSTGASKPGGLFGASTTGTSAPQTGGLFGSTAATSQPQTGGLFGSTATTTQPQTGGLFGSTPAASQPQTGGLFGSTTAASQPQAGGLFGSTATSQPQTGGLFGSSTAISQPQTGGLFGSAGQGGSSLFGGQSNQNQNKPATSLFGGLGSAQNQPPQAQQNSMFSSQAQTQPSSLGPFGGSALGGGLTLGQSTSQSQQTVPGVRIDVTNLRGTTRFNDLHDDLAKAIAQMDQVIQGQIKLKNDCESIMPAHDQQLSQIPNDVNFCSRKLTGVESALVSDVKTIALVRESVKTDAKNAKLSFRAIDNLKLPQQYHSAAIWTSKSSGNRSPEDGEDEAQDIVGFFSATADELAATLNKYQNNLAEIEQHLQSVEAGSVQQINAFVAKKNGSSSAHEDPVMELAGALREFEHSILGVASKVGSTREGVQSLQLGGFTAPATGMGASSRRNGVY
ncbi:Uncharacterized protein BP5553_04161 [Venustampulla echinocandica]|uniref:Uncharacterized protein n=1 Tax=Venustampulla echinocandica TaxID=2656787 RepID=A0A370TWB1_9HELO|nr:Uncharacterized protein BP5553_04161 [Venustampulla echinocandica]RDL39821.1 Uncharacterized protein BP5553_04161 [Venustampulla echinocandica]